LKETPMSRQVIDITQLVDEQRPGLLTIRVISLTFLVMLSDGFDLASTAYAAPGLVQTLGVSRHAMGLVFSASLFGMLFGAPLFGYAGDKFGRKRAIICSSLFYGLFSLACAFVTSLGQLEICRFLVGFGLGGLLPNVTALVAEFAPKRRRASFTTLTFLGLTAGGTIPAITSTVLPPEHWKSLFILGGTFPLMLAPLLMLRLPESIKYMTLRGGREAEISRLARMLRRDLEIAPDAVFIVEEPKRKGPVVAALFQGPLRMITPLLWLAFAANLMVNFFLNSWMPTLLRQAGLSASQSALTASMYYFGGIAGGLVVGRVLDAIGMLGLVIFFTAACPIVAAIGTPNLPQWALMVLLFMTGFSVLGTQLGLSASAGTIYPTAIRSNGAGWAHAVGRLGAIAGPVVAAWLIGLSLPLQYLLFVPVLPLAVGAFASVALTRRYGGPFRQREHNQVLASACEP
jgi:AAHS family 4-hydroxybenzoate transporter-like MFS transporter